MHRAINRYSENPRGFTLIELLVVVLLIGVLAGIAVPYYLKTQEISKANSGAALASMVATANRMYAVDHGALLTGALTSACTAGACGSAGNACDLINCGYLSRQDWSSNPYSVQALNNASCGSGCPGGSYVACAMRQGSASSTYSGWGYVVDATGAEYACGSAPGISGVTQVNAVRGMPRP